MEEWRKFGACADATPVVFYPEMPTPQEGFGKGYFNGEKRNLDITQREIAEKYCHSCPVEDSCLEYALANNEQWGTWGGKTEEERRIILKRRERAA